MDFFYISLPSARRAHRHPQNVIYPPIVGRIYPIQIYIYIHLTHVPQPSARKGAQTPSKCHIFPNCWQCISNINVYSSKSTFPHPAPQGRTNTLQLTYISQLLAEYIQYLCIMSYNFLGMVPNCPRCQIVRFWWWCQIVRCQIVLVPNCPRCQSVRGAKLSWCQIVRGAKLSAVPNCPVPNCPIIFLQGDQVRLCFLISF